MPNKYPFAHKRGSNWQTPVTAELVNTLLGISVSEDDSLVRMISRWVLASLWHKGMEMWRLIHKCKFRFSCNGYDVSCFWF